MVSDYNNINRDNEMTHQSNTENNDISSLQNAVNTMDCIAQTGLSEISAIAKLASKALQNPGTYDDIEIIAIALNAIASKSDDLINIINCEAENVDCNYKDTDSGLRYAAKLKHEQDTNNQRDSKH
jgi:hypothetical protein